MMGRWTPRKTQTLRWAAHMLSGDYATRRKPASTSLRWESDFCTSHDSRITRPFPGRLLCSLSSSSPPTSHPPSNPPVSLSPPPRNKVHQGVRGRGREGRRRSHDDMAHLIPVIAEANFCRNLVMTRIPSGYAVRSELYSATLALPSSLRVPTFVMLAAGTRGQRGIYTDPLYD